ncbi:DUF3662 domain-containing protein [Streptomyces macrosporus]|uniref:FhaA N-terminal domain-containing protein n=1 Tax=Streptomyces macrosporus TaxID=44032 RepID=A0ABN3JIR0_9ACTN
MGALNRWERKVERWEQALLSKVFGDEPVELLDALRHECDSHAVVCSHSRVVVPNAYEVELPGEVYEELERRGGRIGQELTDSLARHGESKGYEWAGPLAVRVTASDHVPNGRYRVTSSPAPQVRVDAFAAPEGETEERTTEEGTEAEEAASSSARS